MEKMEKMEKMVRKQTYISPDQDKALKRRAKKEGTTEAEIIRRAIDRYIREHEALKNPLLDIIGIAGKGPADGSENHDRYIYDRS
ncbi:MAG: ribbon-helix-helix domain-containing protein [Firmicutes bacterium]|nr:ribbon-helix-helix domain-containing protein [Bacillota bacterium]